MLVARKPLPIAPPVATPKPRVKTRSNRCPQLKNMYRLAVVLLVVGLLAFGAVYRQSTVVARNRSINRLKADIAKLESDIAGQQMEVARLSSSAHIERVAREKLGMQKPTANQVLRVGVNGGGN